MVERRIKVVNRLGLHARSAARLVRIAKGFQSEILLVNTATDQKANAKSILSLLYLAAAAGSGIVISADGPDEEEAIRVIAEFFLGGLGEDQ